MDGSLSCRFHHMQRQDAGDEKSCSCFRQNYLLAADAVLKHVHTVLYIAAACEVSLKAENYAQSFW